MISGQWFQRKRSTKLAKNCTKLPKIPHVIGVGLAPKFNKLGKGPPKI